MSQRELLWFLAGASVACAIGAVLLLVFMKRTPVEASLGASPPIGADLHSVAEQMRRQRNHLAARKAYAMLEQKNALTADEWADYADVVATTQNGALSGEPARLIDATLEADPTHPKGLWLRASLAHQQANYGDALVWWKRLQQQLSPDSPDQRIIKANIDEARRLIADPSLRRHQDAQRAPELTLRLGVSIR